jgi:hypothetical protein
MMVIGQPRPIAVTDSDVSARKMHSEGFIRFGGLVTVGALKMLGCGLKK